MLSWLVSIQKRQNEHKHDFCCFFWFLRFFLLSAVSWVVKRSRLKGMEKRLAANERNVNKRVVFVCVHSKRARKHCLSISFFLFSSFSFSLAALAVERELLSETEENWKTQWKFLWILFLFLRTRLKPDRTEQNMKIFYCLLLIGSCVLNANRFIDLCWWHSNTQHCQLESFFIYLFLNLHFAFLSFLIVPSVVYAVGVLW